MKRAHGQKALEHVLTKSKQCQPTKGLPNTKELQLLCNFLVMCMVSLVVETKFVVLGFNALQVKA